MRTLFILTIALLFFSSTAEESNYFLWSGGVSREERAEAPDGGTKLVFFVSGGNYLTGIDVSVKTNSGQELLNVTNTGPWLILDLTAGDYIIVATRGNGDVQSTTISVEGNVAAEFGFMFPDN